MPPSPTSRPGKQVPYDPSYNPLSYLPRPPPFDQRMLGFGCADIGVPRVGEGMGPRTNAFPAASAPSPQLVDSLSVDQSSPQWTHPNLSGTDLSGAGLGLACSSWKSASRRRGLKSLTLNRCALRDDDVLRCLVPLISLSSTPAPLRLDQIDLGSNSIFIEGFLGVLGSFAGNDCARVKEVCFAENHLGSSSFPSSLPSTSSPSSSPSSTGSTGSTGSGVGLIYYAPLVDFFRAPHLSSTVRVVNLSCNGLHDVFLAHLALGVRYSSAIEVIDLEMNEVTCAGVGVLCAALGGRRGEEAMKEQAMLDALATKAREESEEAEARMVAAASGPPRTGSAGRRDAPKTPTAAATKSSSKRSKERDAKADDSDDEDAAAAVSNGLPVFSTVRTNSSLRRLFLSRNAIGVEGMRALESMARHHTALLQCDMHGQRVSSIDRPTVDSLSAAISAQCGRNCREGLRAQQSAFVLGLHSRVGALSSVKAMLNEAKAIAGASTVESATHVKVLQGAMEEVWQFVGCEA